jgi:hypothetical protein
MAIVKRGLASVRYRLSPRVAYVDLHTADDETILVAGSRRSGTTWLGELVNFRNDRRTIFEPFHPLHSSWARRGRLEWAHYSEPAFEDDALFEMCTRLWSGRVRDPWLDKLNTKRIARRRLVKCVECTNLLPWIASHFPHLRIVLILRHPFAVTESQLAVQSSFQDYGLTDLDVLRDRRRLLDGVFETLDDSTEARRLVAQSADPFESHVVRWCLENRIPLSQLDSAGTHVVFYEDLVLHPGEELDRLGHHLAMDFGSAAITAARKPSRTDFRHRARQVLGRQPDVDFLRQWQGLVSPTAVERGLDVLRAFSLDHLYGRDALPLVSAADVLDATQHRVGTTEEVGRIRSGDPRAPGREVGGVDEPSGSVNS